jgi:AcrR family transcriptional regulator
MRRALRPSQKLVRRQAILEAALQAFQETPYPSLTMADLARRLGLGKGTLYLYFPTKESLFLAVLQSLLDSWFQGAGKRLDALAPGRPPREVAGGLVEELMERPLLPPLQALLHGVLEQNVPAGEALAFARFLQEGVLSVGTRLERALPSLPAGRGADFLIRFHGLVIGCQLMSSRPPAVREALEDPQLAIFNFTFPEVILGAAVDLLEGMME